MQSTSKPISYALAITELGAEEVHKFVGYEPSGVSFNQICLNTESKRVPHSWVALFRGKYQINHL